MTIISKLTKESVENNSRVLTINEKEYIYYDFSKSHMTEKDSEVIKNKILENKLISKIEQMWNGENVNYTENRPVLHYLLRDGDVLDEVNGYLEGADNGVIQETSMGKGISGPAQENIKKIKANAEIRDNAKLEIIEELIKIAQFSARFNYLKGITEQSFDTIVNIGIGGSDLGPRMITDALQFYSKNRTVHFISNVDATDTLKVLKKINVEKTLFIVVSKTFTTIETIENFKLVLSLLRSKLDNKFSEHEICSKHFVAVSSNIEETSRYGINTVSKLWDFVGGRFSLWSAVGLSISLSIGFDNFTRLLRGASIADTEFESNRENSISMKMAINELFYISKGYNNKCLVSYDCYLELLYKYLQQAEMESNGKHGSKQMIVWGGVGTDVQHSFFQLLHQGEQQVYLEFLCPIENVNLVKNSEIGLKNREMIEYHQKLLVASCLAQSRSLLVGSKSEDINNHFEGDKPSVTILYSKLTPEILGAILAIYEHKIFIEGIYFNINSFDQFGVALGKSLTNELIKEVGGEGVPDESLDQSTINLLKHLK